MTHTTDQERAEPIKMQPGDDLHLTMLMAPHGLNFVTGKDREHLLAWGRDVWQASRRAQVAPNDVVEAARQVHRLVRAHTFDMQHDDKAKPMWESCAKDAVRTLQYLVDAAAPQPPSEQQAAHKSALGDEGKALAALRYYMHECSGAEPSISVFHRMAEEALETAAPQPPEGLIRENPATQPEAAAEHEALRGVYEAARGLLRYEGVDDGRASTYRSKLASAIEEVKHIDSGLWEPQDSLMSEIRTSKTVAAAVPKFNHAAKRKLELLQVDGASITGYAIEKDGRRGAIDCHGFVYWWNDAAPVQMPEPAVPCAIFDCHGFYGTRATKAAAQSFCDHYNKRDADGGGCAPYTVQALYTEHQVRQLLAQHGVK